MVKSAEESFKNVDCILFVVDDSDKIGKGDSMIIDNLRKAKVPVFLVINKVDKIANKEDIFDLIKMYDQEGVFKEIIPVSALKSSNIDSLIKAIKQTLDVGPKYFPDYMVTDQPERVLVAELIREKVLQYTNDEVPHQQLSTVKETPTRASL